MVKLSAKTDSITIKNQLNMPQQEYPKYDWMEYLLQLDQYIKELEKYIHQHTPTILALGQDDDASLPPPPPPPTPPA